MAQIIQHKRGLLEDLSGVTPNKAELLVVTGSSISALADGLVFVGNSASDITAVNRIITGSSTPDVTGGSYNHFIDGVPFYNTTDKKLEILGKSGNTNVAFTTNSLDLGGSGIVSSSAQVQSLGGVNNSTITLAGGNGLSVSGDGAFTTNQSSNETFTLSLPGGTVSGSSQVFSDVSGDVTIASNGTAAIGTGVIVNADVNASAAISHTKIDFNGSGLQSGSGDISAVTAGDGLTGGGVAGDVTLNVVAGDGLTANADDIQVDNTVLRTTGFGVVSGSVLRPNGDGVVSGSGQVASTFAQTILDDTSAAAVRTTIGVDAAGTDNSTDVTLVGSYDYITISGQVITRNQVDAATDIANLSTNNVTENTNLYYTDARVKTKLNAEGVLSGSTHAGNQTFSDNVTISGDLTVSGTQTIIDSTTLNISGSIIRANYGGSAVDGGLEITDATGGGLATGSLLWDGTNDYWKGGAKGSEARLIQEGGSAGTANKVSKFDAAGTIVNSTITDDGSNVSITGELTVGGLVANSFVVTNGSKQLLEVTPSTAGDIVQWNGSSFAASNVIDGGSF